MAHTANLKTYPKVHLKQEDYGPGFARIPNGVACNRGVWAKVSHKHFRIWVGLRSLQPRAYSRTEIMRLLNLDRRNGLKDLLAMEEAGLVKADGNSLVVVDPEAGKPQAKTEEDQKEEEEEQTKQPATKVITPEVVTPSAPRVTAPIVRHAPGGSAAPDIIDELVQTWNEYNAAKCDGFYYKNVNRKGFSEEAIETVQKHAKALDMTPAAVLKRIMWSGTMTDPYAGVTRSWCSKEGTPPQWLLGTSNSEYHKFAFCVEYRDLHGRKGQIENMIMQQFANDFHNILGKVANTNSEDTILESLCSSRHETIRLMREVAGSVGSEQTVSNLLNLIQTLSDKITGSEEYKAFKANPTKMVAAKEFKRNEKGGWIIEMRPDAHGEMRSRPVEFDIEKKVTTAGDYFPVFTSTSLPSEAPESVFSLFLKACNHYGVLGAKAQGSGEG